MVSCKFSVFFTFKKFLVKRTLLPATKLINIHPYQVLINYYY